MAGLVWMRGLLNLIRRVREGRGMSAGSVRILSMEIVEGDRGATAAEEVLHDEVRAKARPAQGAVARHVYERRESLFEYQWSTVLQRPAAQSVTAWDLPARRQRKGSTGDEKGSKTPQLFDASRRPAARLPHVGPDDAAVVRYTVG